MAPVSAELLAVVERSPQATTAHDREAWVDLFTSDARVEDPYGSQPHAGRERIGRFYDTFIAPRELIFHRDADMVCGSTVVRDLLLEVVMGPGVTLNVPAHLRYDLRGVDGDWAIERLRAYWELPSMVIEMLRQGAKSLPVSARLAGALLRNQGLGGTAGFLAAFRRPGRAEKRCVETFLGAATSGDELAARRLLADGAAVGDVVDRLRGGRWTKVIATGDTVSASVTTPSGRGVIFCEIHSATAGITRVQFFG
jgi:hypothetical protein